MKLPEEEKELLFSIHLYRKKDGIQCESDADFTASNQEMVMCIVEIFRFCKEIAKSGIDIDILQEMK
jgi:hypothetical protein